MSWQDNLNFVNENKIAQQSNSKDRRIVESTKNSFLFSNEDEFIKDRDRILFSRAFRRLEHKAQIYSHKKGDHYRTRLTHTLEVTQIARSIAKNLNLNENLVEAIALGHDIGHTPFGHQGERTLDDIMCGRDTLSDRISPSINYGGFKHNFHSLKILDELEVKFKDISGMNLTWQVMEGIVKHTKIKRKKDSWPLERFIQDKNFLNKYMNENFSVTLEGQIVTISDEIAQRQHDIDDGLKDKDLSINYNSIAIKIYRKIQNILSKYESSDNYISKESIKALKTLNNNIYKNLGLNKISTILENNSEINNKKNALSLLEGIYNNEFNKEMSEQNYINGHMELFKIHQLTSDVINFFITDVTTNSMNNIVKRALHCKNNHDGKVCFSEKLIDFSVYGKEVDDAIEEYIKVKILNSYNVNRFDGNSRYIIKQLFKAYYANPRQMPKSNLEKFQSKAKKVCSKFYDIKLIIDDEEKSIKDIDFNNDKKNIIEAYINLLKFKLYKIELLDYNNKIVKNNSELLNELVNINFEQLSLEELGNKERYIYALREIHYVYLSIICDYIAGMTDNYANDEFKKLYNG